jgi:hypothetical protein
MMPLAEIELVVSGSAASPEVGSNVRASTRVAGNTGDSA